MLCFKSGTLFAATSIAPAYIELNLDRGTASGSFTVTNVGDKTERYRMMASHFDVNASGDLAKAEPNQYSLVPWMKFNPKEFSLPPKSKRTIRFVVAPTGKVQDHAYWAFMELEPLTITEMKSKDESGRTFNIKVSSSILVPIFATKGNVTYTPTLLDVKIVSGAKGKQVEATLSNEGTGHLFTALKYMITDESGDFLKEGVLNQGFLFPGNKCRFKKIIEGEIPKGDYKVLVTCQARQIKDPIIVEIPYTW